MNNIDILEEFKDIVDESRQEDNYEYYIKLRNTLDLIKTLIAENKELKEMLKHRIEYTNKLEKDLFQNASNYVIPKSKVEEKIEELEKGDKNTFIRGEKILVLQSLLGKE